MTDPLSRLRHFLRELKRRNVYKVAVTYTAVVFVGLQAVRLLVPATTLPGWADELLIALAVLGFPIAVVIAWAFEMSPEGMRRTPEAEGGATSSGVYQWIGLTLVVFLAGGVWYITTGEEESRSARKVAATDTVQGEPAPAPRLGRRSIAVLPFDNLSGTDDAQPFVNGIHDDLLTRLSNISELRVISRTSVLPYRDSDLSLRAIGDSPGVRWILEGGVQHAGDQVQVNAQLIQAEEDVHHWAESYRRKLTTDNLFAIQSELAKRIARSLEAQITAGEQRRIEGEPTESLEAYRLYVQGRDLLDRRTAASIDSARDYFQRALRQDSTYALAWAGLADARVLNPQYAHQQSSRTLYEELVPAIPEAKAAARRALELDPDLAEGHTSLAYAYLLDLQGPAALAELRRAVDLRPSYSQAQDWSGGLLLSLGRPEAALRHLELAVELNPSNQNAPVWLNQAFVANGQYEEALAQARRLGNRALEAQALVHLRQWTAARRVAHASLDRNEANRWMQSFLALADLADGDTASAVRRREGLRASSEFANPIPLGLVHAALGEDSSAVAAFDRIFDGHSGPPPPHLGHLEYFQLRYHYPEILGPLRAGVRQ